MNELTLRIMRRIHEFYQIGNFFSEDVLHNWLGEDVGLPDIQASLADLQSYGYVKQHIGPAWEVVAFDKSMSCAVCGKYAPKHCPGCKHVFCGEHYEAHAENNLKGPRN